MTRARSTSTIAATSKRSARLRLGLGSLAFVSSFITASGCSEPPLRDGGSGGALPPAGAATDATSGAGGAAGNENAGLGGGAGLETAGSANAGVGGVGDAAGTSGSAGSPGAGSGGVAGEAAGGNDGGVAGQQNLGGLDCVPTGSVSYTLVRASQPISAEAAAYALIVAAMDLAVGYYNCYTDLALEIEVRFDATFAIVETRGTVIRFGAMDAMNPVTAMHEIARIAGVGSPEFAALVEGGVFTGENATAELRAITGDESATLYADAQQFWPYGLNYPNEVKSLSDLVNHCRLVVAIRKDLAF